MRWARNVTRNRQTINAYIILVGKPEEGRERLKDLGVGRTIILKCILRNEGWGGVNLFHLAHDRVWWQALLNREKTFGFPDMKE
jgi:hypothetical protein